MAQSIRSTICQINNALSPVFPGSKFYGVAVSTEKEKKVQPVSDEMPVSYDDDYSLQAYHKMIIQSTPLVCQCLFSTMIKEPG